MTSDEGRRPEGAPQRSPKAGVGAPSGGLWDIRATLLFGLLPGRVDIRGRATCSFRDA
jgi:hypothetical protein